MESFQPIQEQFAAKAAENKIKKGLFGYKYAVTGKPVQKRVEYYDVQEKNYLLDCATGKITENRYARKSASETLGVIAYVETDKNFIALQIQQYVPYMYQAITDTAFFHGEQAQQICKALNL